MRDKIIGVNSGIVSPNVEEIERAAAAIVSVNDVRVNPLDRLV